MHAGSDYDLATEMTMPMPRVSVPSASRPSGPLSPHRLVPLAAPTVDRRVIADLRFPGDLVHARATEYAHEARQTGAQHNLKLWREGCRAALIALARAATAAPADATCESLAWQMAGDDYLVSVIFTPPATPIIH